VKLPHKKELGYRALNNLLTIEKKTPIKDKTTIGSPSSVQWTMIMFFLTNLKKNTEGQPDPNSQIVVESGAEEEQSHDEWYICRNCRQKIVQPVEAVNIQGTHHHIFANPSGIVFEIACFGTARGYTFVGPPSLEFAWFAGHSWRIVICSNCLIHLGWMFSSSTGTHFFGLILDRLRLQSLNKK
jgi:hypothetical protein